LTYTKAAMPCSCS